MNKETLKRRNFLKTVGAAAIPLGLAASAVMADDKAEAAKTPHFLAINTSYRPGMTTAAGLKKVLESIQAENPAATVELLELSDYDLRGYFPTGTPEEKQVDQFGEIVAILENPNLAGVILGSPTYNGTMSSLCKIFIEKCNPLKKTGLLKNKVVGFVASGGARNGGQELVLQTITMSWNGHRLIHADDMAHWGATLWNRDDSIEEDEAGVGMCQRLGVRMAELAGMVK